MTMQIPINVKLVEKSEPHIGLVFGSYGIYVKGIAYPVVYRLWIPREFEWNGSTIIRGTPIATVKAFKMKVPSVDKRRTIDITRLIHKKFINLDEPKVHGKVYDVEYTEIAKAIDLDISREHKVEYDDYLIFYEPTKASVVDIELPLEVLKAIAEKAKEVQVGSTEEYIEIPVEFDKPRLLPPRIYFEYEDAQWTIDLEPVLPRGSVKRIVLCRDERKMIIVVDPRKVVRAISFTIYAVKKNGEKEVLTSGEYIMLRIDEDAGWEKLNEELREASKKASELWHKGELEKVEAVVSPALKSYVETMLNWFKWKGLLDIKIV